MGIKIVVDSGSDLSLQDAQDLGVELVPLTVTFGEKPYLDGIEISKDEFYDKLVNSGQHPVTGAPSPENFMTAFKKVLAGGDKVFCITLSSKVSATYQSAKIAADALGDDVYVMDSFNLALGERIIVEHAVKKIEEGMEFEELIEYMEKKKFDAKIFAYLDSLVYIQRGGRLSKFASVLGGFLSIKPILMVDENGELALPDKVRGIKKGFDTLNRLFVELGGEDVEEIHFSYSGLDKDNLEKYLEAGAEHFTGKKINVRQLGSTIGTHAGPGAVVVAFMR